MPLSLWALAISAYAIGTTEFVIVGLLPTVAADLAISVPQAGLIVSVYALGVTVGAPVLTALTGRLGRKALLCWLMALFIAGNLAAAFAPGYGILLAARVASAFAHGVFFSVGSTIAAALVAPERRATAIATMFSGLTVAIVTGVPLGTWIGQGFGWRATFLAVAGLGALGLLGILRLLPRDLPREVPATLLDQARVLARPRLLLAFAITALGYGGTFVAFTYLSPILQQLTALSENQVSLVLVLYGLGIAAGNVLGGRLADGDPIRALLWLFGLQAVVLVAFTFTSSATFPALATLTALGLLSFATVPGLQLYVVQLARAEAPGAVDTASAFNIGAFNLGIALGAAVGGQVVASPLGLAATPWVGGLLVLAAWALTAWSGSLDRHSVGLLPSAATGR